jgi:hypothetical protein
LNSMSFMRTTTYHVCRVFRKINLMGRREESNLGWPLDGARATTTPHRPLDRGHRRWDAGS